MEKSDFEELKIICAEDCGNAPKKILIKDFITAMACNDQNCINDNITSDIFWNIVGGKTTQGKEQFIQNLQHQYKIFEVHINNIITHGNTCAANGTITLDIGCIAFCNVYHFNSAKNAKIKEITSYFIPC